MLLACLLAGAHGAGFYDLEPVPDSDTLAMQLTAATRKIVDDHCVNETIPWLQIGFAMDCTGSTGPYLAALKTTVGDLATELAAQVTTLHMAFLCYRDEGDTPPLSSLPVGRAP